MKRDSLLRHIWCPAVLTENFIMDNKSDLKFIQSRAAKQVAESVFF